MHLIPTFDILKIEFGGIPPDRSPHKEYLARITEQSKWAQIAPHFIKKGHFSIGFKTEFHTFWTTAGHHIRDQVQDDKVVTNLLRIALPPYLGKERVLFRGENNDRFMEGKVGFCWSDKIEVARMFGRGMNAIGSGGILIKCIAPHTAIISSPSTHSLYLQEYEFTADPSKIISVEIIERYPPID